MPTRTRRLRRLSYCAGAFALLAGLEAGFAFAQTGDIADPLTPDAATRVVPAADPSIDEVIVTAQRRVGTLQTTSASISAYSPEALEVLNLENIEDIGLIDPSAQVALYQGEAQIFLRGVGTPITVGGTDSATAIYRDGEFLSRAAASVPGFFDVSQVEILKGPQGTLYGRNATAGSVVITSNAPTEDFAGYGSVTVGNYDRFDLEAAIGGPIVEDALLFRLAAKSANRDGYTTLNRNTNAALDVEDQEEWFLRGTLEWRVTPELTLSATGDYYEADDRATNFFLLDASYGFAQPPFNPDGPAINTFGIPAGNFGINNFTLLGQIAGDVSALATRDDQFGNTRSFNTPEIWGVSGRFDWDVGAFNLSGVTAYRETKPENFVDFDLSNSPQGRQTQFRAEDQWQFTQEVLLTSPELGRLRFIAGGSVFIEENFIRNEYLIGSLPTLFDFAVDNGIFPETIADRPVRIPFGDSECCVFELNGELETDAYSAFIDGSYDLTDRLTVQAGLRYSREERSGRNLLATELELQNPVLLGPPFTNVADFEEETFDAFTPKLGLDFDLSSDVFLYGSVQRGFKSGGFNIGSLQNDSFDQELTWAYEAGLRSDWLGGRARFNATGFYYDVNDLQVQTVVNNSIVVNNAAGAEVWGAEVDGRFTPLDDLTLDFAATWLDTEITEVDVAAAIDPTRISVPTDPALASVVNDPENLPATGAFDIVGNRLPKAPEWQFRVGAQYVLGLPDGGELTLRADWAYQDDIFFNQFNDTGFDALPVAPLTQDGYSWLKARIAYDSPSEAVTIAAFVDNITDEEVITNAVFNGAVSGQFGLGSLAPPRTLGVQLISRF